MTPEEMKAELARLFHEFKTENDKQLAEAKAEAMGGKKMTARLDEIERKANRALMPGGAEPAGALGQEEAKAFDRFLRSGEIERKAMSIASSPEGGFLLAGQLADAIQSVAATMGAIRQLSRVFKADSADFSQPIATSFAGTGWVGESTTRSNTATPNLAMVKPTSGGLSAVAPVSNWLLNDANYDVAGFVTESIGQGLGLAESTAFITGTGINRPTGILSGAYLLDTAGDSTRAFGSLQKVKSGTSGVLSSDNLIDLLYALAPQYRKRAAYVMNPSTVAAVRKLKASTSGDYIWQPSSVAGQPSTLFGAPVYEDPNMPVIGAGASAVLCGDFQAGYLVIDIGQPMMLRDQISSKGTTLFYVERRVGGSVTDSNALKVLTLEV
jgi:HK97 family phage major capsid protein